MNPILELSTEQETITLRQLAPEDAAAYFDAVDANRDHLSQFGDETADKYPTLASVEDSIANPNNPDKLRMGIWEGGTFVGSINLTPSDDGSDAEVGYWLDKRYTGNGYATVATKALAGYAKNKFRRVHAEVVEGNEASIGVLERAGFHETARITGKLIFELSNSETGEVSSEQVGHFFGILASRLDDVPELQTIMDTAHGNPEVSTTIFGQYIDVVKRLSQLGPDEMASVRESWDKLMSGRGDVNSASKHNALDIFSKLDDAGRAELANQAPQSINPESPYFEAAVSDFVARTEGGHQLKVDGKTPVDGDPASDKVIWGHTQVTDPEALLHFTVSHYLERYFSQCLAAEGVEFAANHKDYFLNAMTDVLMLDHFEENRFATIFDVWAKPRNEGGLGWIKEDRIEAYKPDAE